jgi:hypothetical protein
MLGLSLAQWLGNGGVGGEFGLLSSLERGNPAAHAISLHGPEVSDEILQARILDGVERATKFTSWEEMGNTDVST